MDFKVYEFVNRHSFTFEHKVTVSNRIILSKVEMGFEGIQG